MDVKLVLRLHVIGIFCGVVFSSTPVDLSTLRLVSVLYRHGDRSPASIYPKDIHQVPDAWPDGLGWLSKIGMRQQYELGQYIKQRYDGYLNTTYYNHNEILIQASGVDRCLMSAYCNLAGLFKPGEAQEWNDKIPWQPIPVQTSPKENDMKLALQAPCPRYDQLKEEVLNSPAIKKEEKENKDFYDMVEGNTGIKKETIDDIWKVADTLVCEKAHNLTWNDWAYKEGVWPKLLALQTLSFDIMYEKKEMTKLKGGPLLKEIITNMKAAVALKDGAEPSPKFYMYSAHDTTVAALLSAMKVFDKKAPIYRALVIVELHQIDQDYVVKISYKNDSTKEPFELVPKGCDKDCTLDEFVDVTKDTVPVDWDKECVSKGPSSSGSSLTPASWITLGIGICLFAVVGIALVIMFVRLRRKHSPVYSRI